MIRVAVALAPDVRQLLDEDPSQVSEFLDEIHDEDLADLVELLGKDEAVKLLGAVPPEQAARIFERLDEAHQGMLVEQIGVEKVAPIVVEMAADDRADLLSMLPDKVGETLLETIERVDPEAAAEVEQLVQWPEDSAGGLMTTDYVSVSPTATVADVIEKIRTEGTEAETVYYVYVVGKAGRLHGVASLRDLLLAEAKSSISDVMTEMVHAVSPTMDQEEVARTMAKYDFAALPVVGPQQKLLGVITVDDVMDVLTEEAGEDVQRIAAMEPTEETYFRVPFWTFIRKRVVWLMVLFIGGSFTANALRSYEDVIAAVATLAFYVPVLISTGGNSGSQSAALVIRGLATGEVVIADWHKVLVRELAQGLVMGFVLGGLGAARVYLAGDGGLFAATIFLTLLAIVTVSTVVGSMFPLLLRKVGLDPATSSSPFIASVLDLLGIIVYFSIASVLLRELIAAAM